MKQRTSYETYKLHRMLGRIHEDILNVFIDKARFNVKRDVVDVLMFWEAYEDKVHDKIRRDETIKQ